MNFEEEVKKLLEKELKKKVEIEVPANQEHGDYAYPCFELARSYKKNPIEIAKNIASKLKSDLFEINNAGPYVNFKIQKNKIAKIILSDVLKEKDNYGRMKTGENVLIEHTSINPNAPPHVGSARNALIGDSIARIYRFLGYKTDIHYYINDVGKQIAYLALGLKGKPKFGQLMKVYVEMSKKAEKDEKIEKQALQLLAKLEKGDKAVKNKFKKIVDVCVNGQVNILSELGIKYDKFDYESKYLWDKSVNEVLWRLEKSGKVFTDEHGRKVLDQKEFEFAMKQPLLVLTRGDGTSLYVLRDLAYTIDKLKMAKKNIVVLGEDQKLYFQQLAAALKLLGYEQPEIIHYSFILLESKKMQKRQGNFVLLQDFMDELLKKAGSELKKRYKKIDRQLAMKIAYGALKYSILRVSPEKNVNFDWDQALSLDGDSAPYIQYSYARASSILRKAKPVARADLSLLQKDEELRLIKHISKFKDTIATMKPQAIAAYAFDLAQLFNEFYHNCQVIGKDKEIMYARLELVKATRYTLKNALDLLGIEAVEKM